MIMAFLSWLGGFIVTCLIFAFLPRKIQDGILKVASFVFRKIGQIVKWLFRSPKHLLAIPAALIGILALAILLARSTVNYSVFDEYMEYVEEHPEYLEKNYKTLDKDQYKESLDEDDWPLF